MTTKSIVFSLALTAVGGVGNMALALDENGNDAFVNQQALNTSIRNQITNDPTLSLDAKNIIINNSQDTITLSGVVDSQAEHQRILDIVQKTSSNNVSDLITVK